MLAGRKNNYVLLIPVCTRGKIWLLAHIFAWLVSQLVSNTVKTLILFGRAFRFMALESHRLVATPERFELPTPGSEDQCSNPLSYGAVAVVV